MYSISEGWPLIGYLGGGGGPESPLHSELCILQIRIKKSKFDFPHIKMLIAHRVVRGMSQRSIAEELRTSQPTVSKIVRQSNVRNMIKEEENILIQQVKEILEQLRNDPSIRLQIWKVLGKELLNFKRLL